MSALNQNFVQTVHCKFTPPQLSYLPLEARWHGSVSSSTLQSWVVASKLPFRNGTWQVPAPRVWLRSVWEVHRGRNYARTSWTIRTAAAQCLSPSNVYQHRQSHRLHPSQPLQMCIHSTMSARLRGGFLLKVYPCSKKHWSLPSRDPSSSDCKTSWEDWGYAHHRAGKQTATQSENTCRVSLLSTISLDLTATFPQANNGFWTHSSILTSCPTEAALWKNSSLQCATSIRWSNAPKLWIHVQGLIRDHFQPRCFLQVFFNHDSAGCCVSPGANELRAVLI